MIQIYYGPTVLVISLIWIAVRILFAARQKQISWKRELQLPFFDRVTDVDDLILNSLGFAAGYGIYLLVKTIKKKVRHP